MTLATMRPLQILYSPEKRRRDGKQQVRGRGEQREEARQNERAATVADGDSIGYLTLVLFAVAAFVGFSALVTTTGILETFVISCLRDLFWDSGLLFILTENMRQLSYVSFTEELRI